MTGEKDDDRDILEVRINGKSILMSRLAVRLAKFPVDVVGVFAYAEEPS